MSYDDGKSYDDYKVKIKSIYAQKKCNHGTTIWSLIFVSNNKVFTCRKIIFEVDSNQKTLNIFIIRRFSDINSLKLIPEF